MKLKKNLVLRRVGSKYMIVDLEAETVDFAYVFQMNAVAAGYAKSMKWTVRLRFMMLVS